MIQYLFAAAVLLAGGASHAETTYLGAYSIAANNGEFGGLSAIHMHDDGRGFVSISDRGGIFNGTITRDAGGAITQITTTPLQDIKKKRGLETRDSEGIAIAADGTIYISFEGEHRVGRFTALDGDEDTLPVPALFDALQSNGGLEALAIDATGALFAIPERSGRYNRPFPVFRYRDGVWDQPYAIARSGSFLMVGADFGPDGRLYLLERDFNGIGFFSRVRRVDFAAGTSETIFQTRFGQHGNLEGISIWSTPSGDTIMTLIADNNFQSFLKNEVVEYRIDG